MARLFTGKVTSDKADKTIVVSVARRQTHPIYKKQYSVNTKYMAHDEKNQAKIGDLVLIREARPFSAKKHFVMDKIIESSGDVFSESDATAGVEEVVEPTDEKAKAKKAPKKKDTKL